jgi:hypothetical protein
LRYIYYSSCLLIINIGGYLPAAVNTVARMPYSKTRNHFQLFYLFLKTHYSTLETGVASLLFCTVKTKALKKTTTKLKQHRKKVELSNTLKTGSPAGTFTVGAHSEKPHE